MAEEKAEQGDKDYIKAGDEGRLSRTGLCYSGALEGHREKKSRTDPYSALPRGAAQSAQGTGRETAPPYDDGSEAETRRIEKESGGAQNALFLGHEIEAPDQRDQKQTELRPARGEGLFENSRAFYRQHGGKLAKSLLFRTAVMKF